MIFQIKVYLKDGLLVVQDTGTKKITRGNPSDFGVQYIDTPTRSADRLTILYFGRVLIDNKYIDQYYTENGTVITPNVQISELLSYFGTLGLGQAGGGVTVNQQVTNSPNAVSGAAVLAYTFSKEQILDLLGGVTQLTTPSPTQTSVSPTTATFSWQAIPNATSYDIYKGDTFITNITNLSYMASGLTVSTSYTFGVVAKAAGYIDSNMGTVNITTSALSPTTLLLPFTLPKTLTA